MWLHVTLQEACNFVRGVILEGNNPRSNKDKNKGFFKDDTDHNHNNNHNHNHNHNNNNNNNNNHHHNNNNKISKEGSKEANGITPSELNTVCEKLVSAALTRGSADNVSVVVVMFGQSSSQI